MRSRTTTWWSGENKPSWQMDDGTLIKLTVTIDREQGTAVFDWTGTGPQTLGNVSGSGSSNRTFTISGG